MDKQYSREFFSSLVSALQDVCRVYLDFTESVDVSGYLAVELDGRQRERYVLSELIHASGTGVSESYCIKAFKTMKPMARSSTELMLGVKRRRKDSLERQLDMLIPQQSPCPSTSGSDCGVRGYRSSLEGASVDTGISGGHSRDSSPVQNLLKALKHSSSRTSEVVSGSEGSLEKKSPISDSRQGKREFLVDRQPNQKSLTTSHKTCQCCQQGNDSVQYVTEAQENQSMSTKRRRWKSDTSKADPMQSEQKSPTNSSSSDSGRSQQKLSHQSLLKSCPGKTGTQSTVHTERTSKHQSCWSAGKNCREIPQSPNHLDVSSNQRRGVTADSDLISTTSSQEHSERNTCREIPHRALPLDSNSNNRCARNTASHKMGVMSATHRKQKAQPNTGDDEASTARNKSQKRHLSPESGLDSQLTVSLCRSKHLETAEVSSDSDSGAQPGTEGDPGDDSDGESKQQEDQHDGNAGCQSDKKRLKSSTAGKVKKFKSAKMTASDLLKSLSKVSEVSQHQTEDNKPSEKLNRCGTKNKQSEGSISLQAKRTDSDEHRTNERKRSETVVSESRVYTPSQIVVSNEDIDDIVIKEEISDIKSEEDSQRLVIDMGDEALDVEDDDEDEEDANHLCAETDSELEAIDRNVRTAQKTRYHLNLLRSHLLTWSETRAVEDIPSNKLDTFLSTFFATVRKESGEDYEPMSLSSIQSSIDRHLRKARYPYSIKKDKQFAHSRSVLEARQRLLGSSGEKKQRTPAEITEGEITLLFKTGQLGMETPQALLNTAWFLNNIHFGLRSSMEHYYLRWGDMNLETDNDGQEWLLMTCRRPGGEESVVRVPASEGDPTRCCVNVYKTYRSVRPLEMCKPDSPFYLTVNIHRKESDYWYKAQTMGYNKFGSNLRKMAAAAGLSAQKFSSTAVQLAPET